MNSVYLTFIDLGHYQRRILDADGSPPTFHFQIDLGVLGFEQFLSELQTEYLAPLTKVLYPDWGGDQLDTHKAFIVPYKEGRNLDVSYHFDNSEVCLCLFLNYITIIRDII